MQLFETDALSSHAISKDVGVYESKLSFASALFTLDGRHSQVLMERKVKAKKVASFTGSPLVPTKNRKEACIDSHVIPLQHVISII